MQDFRKLQIWQKAHELTLLIYRPTVDFPRDEIFGLRTQLRKTSIDIAAQIAEGSSKPNDTEFAKCVSTALGFANRLEYLALVGFDLKMVGDMQYREMNDAIVEAEKMLSVFWQKLTRYERNSAESRL